MFNKSTEGKTMKPQELKKIPFKQVDQSTLQQIASDLVRKEVFVNQSSLVSELFEKQIIDCDNYENFCMTDEMIKEHHNVETEEEIQEIRDNAEDIQEVFEHWVCSNWLIEKLKEQGEPILETDFETWWGRTCTGQSIYLDHNIQELAYEYSYDQRLFEKVA